MYARLDDELIDHRKLFIAGEAIGKNGPAIALGVYALGLLWANKHLSDGELPHEVVRSFSRHVANPNSVAAALTKAKLWERNGSGFRIHDYHAYGNPSGANVRAKRRDDKARKQEERKQRGRAK